MTKREIKKAAYQAIVKENKTHQEVFDELRTKGSIELDTLAEEIAKIPSPAKHNSQQTLRYIFVGVLSVVIILRILSVISLASMNINPNILILAVVLGLVVPALGIYGALASKVEFYRTTGILLVLSVFRSFTNGQVSADPIDYIVLVPFVAAIALAFYIPTKLKTSYSKKVSKQEVNGKMKPRLDFVFDSSTVDNQNELLDADLS